MQSNSKLKTNLFVAKTLASSVRTLLGPCQSVKCCVSEDESIICGNAAKLLQFIDIEHPAGFVINDACQGLHKTYGKGCKTLVCLIGFWSSEAENLLDKGVPVPVIVDLFQQALEHCLSVLKNVAIPLDVSKLILQQTSNSCSKAAQKHKVRPKEMSTKQVLTYNSVRCGAFGTALLSPESKHPSSVFQKDVITSETNAALRLETENGNENELLDNEEDVSWFFDSQLGSDPLNFNALQIECSTSEQVKNRSYLEERSLQEHLDETEPFPSHNSKSTTCSDEYKPRFEIKSKTKHNAPENTVVSNQELVKQSVIWKQASSCSTAVLSASQMYGKTEPVIRLHNVDLRERLANLFQEKGKGLKPNLNSFSKYSRSIFCNDTNDSSNIQPTSFLNDKNISGQNCEPTDSTSNDEFSSCFDNIPSAMESAFKTSRVSLSNNPNRKLLDMKTEPKRRNVNSRLEYLLQEMQNDIEHTLVIQKISKYSRLVTDIKTSVGEVQENLKLPSDATNETPTDFDTQRLVTHHAWYEAPPYTVSSLNILGKRLNHGKKKEMDLAVEVVHTQIKYKEEKMPSETKIESKSLHVETIVGPSSLEARVVDGLVIEVDDVDANLIKGISGKPLSFVLVNGDITPHFRHPGFINATAVKQILHTENDMKKSKSNRLVWFERIEETFRKLIINVVIVKGVVDDMVADYCKAMGVLVVQNVMPSKLQVLSINFEVPIAMYLTDIRKTEVGGPVTVDLFESGWSPLKYRKPASKCISTTFKKMRFVVIRNVFSCKKPISSNRFPLQTVIITGPSKDIACDSEMCFWSCFHSLKNAIYCKKILPGAGSSERACIQELERLKNQVEVMKRPLVKMWTTNVLGEFHPLVYDAFISGFKTYLLSVVFNSGLFSSNSQAMAFLEGRLRETGEQVLPNLVNSSFSYFRQSDESEAMGNDSSCQGRKLKSSGNEEYMKTTEELSYEVVWDDFMGKCEAWRRAVGVVIILLQSDVLVTKGVGRT